MLYINAIAWETYNDSIIRTPSDFKDRIIMRGNHHSSICTFSNSSNFNIHNKEYKNVLRSSGSASLLKIEISPCSLATAKIVLPPRFEPARIRHYYK